MQISRWAQENNILQRTLQLQCYSVGRRGEDLSTFRRPLRYLLVGSDTGNNFYL